jgi:hypothetical protein
VRYLALFPIDRCNMAAVTSLCEGLYLLMCAPGPASYFESTRQFQKRCKVWRLEVTPDPPKLK